MREEPTVGGPRGANMSELNEGGFVQQLKHNLGLMLWQPKLPQWGCVSIIIIIIMMIRQKQTQCYFATCLRAV